MVTDLKDFIGRSLLHIKTYEVLRSLVDQIARGRRGKPLGRPHRASRGPGYGLKQTNHPTHGQPCRQITLAAGGNHGVEVREIGCRHLFCDADNLIGTHAT